jgi:hypothetical protein
MPACRGWRVAIEPCRPTKHADPASLGALVSALSYWQNPARGGSTRPHARLAMAPDAEVALHGRFGAMALFTVAAIITSFGRRHYAGSERRLLMRGSALCVEG